MPFKQIAENAGLNGDRLIRDVQNWPRIGDLISAALIQMIYRNRKERFDGGRNHRSGESYPHCLQNAASVAGEMLTTEAVVVDKPEPKSALEQ
jgi:chaperonin GroEL